MKLISLVKEKSWWRIIQRIELLRHLGQKESAGIYGSQEIPVVRASSVARDQTYTLAKM